MNNKPCRGRRAMGLAAALADLPSTGRRSSRPMLFSFDREKEGLWASRIFLRRGESPRRPRLFSLDAEDRHRRPPGDGEPCYREPPEGVCRGRCRRKRRSDLSRRHHTQRGVNTILLLMMIIITIKLHNDASTLGRHHHRSTG
jgi:hypothetical protein